MRTGIVGAADSDVDFKNHINRVSDDTLNLRSSLKTLIVGLKRDGLWDKIDILNVPHNNKADSDLNLKGNTAAAPDSDSTDLPLGKFRENWGYTTNVGDTISIPTTESDLPQFQQYSKHIFCYTTTWPVVLFDKNTIVASNTQNEIYTLNFSDSFDDVITLTVSGLTEQFQTEISPTGFFACSSEHQSSHHYRVNDQTRDSVTVATGVTVESVAELTVGIDTLDLNPSVGEIGCWGWGGGLTQAELGMYKDRIQTYVESRRMEDVRPVITAHVARLADTSNDIYTHLFNLVGGLAIDDIWKKIDCLNIPHNTIADSKFNIGALGSSADMVAAWSLSINGAFVADDNISYWDSPYTSANYFAVEDATQGMYGSPTNNNITSGDVWTSIGSDIWRWKLGNTNRIYTNDSSGQNVATNDITLAGLQHVANGVIPLTLVTSLDFYQNGTNYQNSVSSDEVSTATLMPIIGNYSALDTVIAPVLDTGLEFFAFYLGGYISPLEADLMKARFDTYNTGMGIS